MSAKHTPGPWFIADDDSHGQAVVRQEHIEIATCWHHCVGSIEQEMRANARLIAAAPDLLEALREMISPYERLLGVELFEALEAPLATKVQAARAAIARATGEQG